MIVTLQTERLATLDQVRALVEGNEAVDFAGAGRRSTYEFIGRTLGRFGYRTLARSDKGLVRRYLAKVTGLSRAQLTRLGRQYLRQSFLDGSLTRLVDPEKVLQRKVVEFVESGAFGLASGTREEGGYERLWYAEPVGRDEVAFERDVFLLTRAKAEQLRAAPPGGAPKAEGGPDPETTHRPAPETETGPPPGPAPGPRERTATLRMKGAVPPEVWNRLGTKVIPKLRAGDGLTVGVDFHVSLPARQAEALESELRQVLADLELTAAVRMERS